jgi:hypothetical protein
MYAASKALTGAASDYRWLLDSSYPGQASLKLVGDRFALDRAERQVLYRGVFPSGVSAARRAMLASPGDAAGRTLLIDGYNQIYAILHYLAGRPVFVSSDGLLRDAGEAHGRVSDPGLFSRATKLLSAAVALLSAGRIVAYFDSPVPFSSAHALAFQAALAEAGTTAECLLARSADFPLKEALPGSAVATGDSAIIDALAERSPGTLVLDAARLAIESAFGARPWLDLGDVLSSDS